MTVRKRVLADANGLGEEVESWPQASDTLGYWCKARRLSGTERIAAGAMNSSDVIEFEVNGPADIPSTARVVYAGQEYSIRSVYEKRGDTIRDRNTIVLAFLPVPGA